MAGMSPIVKNITRMVVGFVAVFGVYDVMYGHVEPGGGFSGGVILAASLILVVLAFGGEFARRVVSFAAARWTSSAGALVFLAVALGGYGAEVFFMNFLARGEVGELASAGTIALSGLAVAVEVAAALFGVFLALAMFRRTIAAGRERGDMTSC